MIARIGSWLGSRNRLLLVLVGLAMIAGLIVPATVGSIAAANDDEGDAPGVNAAGNPRFAFSDFCGVSLSATNALALKAGTLNVTVDASGANGNLHTPGAEVVNHLVSARGVVVGG